VGLTPTFPTFQCYGTLVLLGDQPLITPVLLNQLIEMKYTTGKRIIAPFYNGKRGHPVLFDAGLFPELLTITGDEGGRSVIEKHRTEVGILDVDDSQLWYDVDTWEAYQQVLHIWQEE
jgi:molybdenum cofactor cytidylyltransferase